MKTLKFLTVTALASLVFISCGDDDDITGNDLRVNLYATSNLSGDITAYQIEDDGDVEVRTLRTIQENTDAEGLYVDSGDDEITVVSRSNKNLNTFDSLDRTDNGDALELEAGSPTILGSPRDLAVSSNIYVVSDNMDVDGDDTTVDNRLWVFTRNDNTYTLRNVITTDFAVWGIEFVGDNLYAVVDKTNEVALFSNFSSNFIMTGPAAPTKRVAIEGITRTHGIGFDGGTMVLTDIGEASGDVSPNFNTDGGFHIINDFQAKFSAVENGGTLAVAGNQVRVAGSNTFLGNPVSVDYDADGNTVYIAERANSGGRILAFTNVSTGGNIAPNLNNILSGASSVVFSED
ncbi:hypothetical protein ULMS_17850 [Patiriisocius marinistellae]|uniref:Uncharacterized protein n=1 Tax=Patiriisocius marinistellae TaxID=2494560 RepID=A0A5J4FUI1_9FLAO|nr:hypothetical protein [Patiriisocius marinistellae]GEQ86277.1 hypothetical protein ULMS_17850 [Patiriisocius marinistellae]